MYDKKLAIYIKNQIKYSELTFENAYLRPSRGYEFRRANFHVSKSRTNYGYQKLTYAIPRALNAHPHLLSMAMESRSDQTYKRAVHDMLFS